VEKTLPDSTARQKTEFILNKELILNLEEEESSSPERSPTDTRMLRLTPRHLQTFEIQRLDKGGNLEN
jgi:hypothetical protein